MNAQTSNMHRYGTSVRDIIVAKAIQNGYNPYCKSTDVGARRVTADMKEKVKHIAVPETRAVTAKQKAVVREVSAAPAKKENRPRREVISIENFEIVTRRTRSLSLGMIVSVLVTAMVLAMVVYSGSFINEEARRYNELSGTLAALKEDDKNLSLALEEKNDIEIIENIALNELGMVAANATEQGYLSLSAGDSVKVYDVNNEDTSVTVNLLNTFGEKISDFLEYLD
ncbi:MAG: hypothetical protein E7598_03860 [Ruminococcaceae bacterium]|nr:hypothetical protein [Oscillospiraceae bacterium]